MTDLVDVCVCVCVDNNLKTTADICCLLGSYSYVDWRKISDKFADN